MIKNLYQLNPDNWLGFISGDNYCEGIDDKEQTQVWQIHWLIQTIALIGLIRAFELILSREA